jgi:hypothetical protein
MDSYATTRLVSGCCLERERGSFGGKHGRGVNVTRIRLERSTGGREKRGLSSAHYITDHTRTTTRHSTVFFRFPILDPPHSSKRFLYHVSQFVGILILSISSSRSLTSSRQTDRPALLLRDRGDRNDHDPLAHVEVRQIRLSHPS